MVYQNVMIFIGHPVHSKGAVTFTFSCSCLSIDIEYAYWSMQESLKNKQSWTPMMSLISHSQSNFVAKHQRNIINVNKHTSYIK